MHAAFARELERLVVGVTPACADRARFFSSVRSRLEDTTVAGAAAGGGHDGGGGGGGGSDGDCDDEKLVSKVSFFAPTAPTGAAERRRLLLGTRNYVLQALVRLYGRDGAVSFCRSYLDPRRWSELQPVGFLEL